MSLDGLRVLVVEDELLVAMEIETLLDRLGCEVVGPVASVREALDTIREREVDGAILDVNLHGEYAYPAAEALRARAVPFVFLSGYTDLPDPPPALGDVPTLRKPFVGAEVGEALARVCGRVAA
jgi:CheY-like chemotaxis protein